MDRFQAKKILKEKMEKGELHRAPIYRYDRQHQSVWPISKNVSAEAWINSLQSPSPKLIWLTK